MAEWRGTILALDLATTTGWAMGEPGGRPTFGSRRHAPVGASQPEIAAGAIKWIAELCSAFPPRCIVFEAPELFRLRSGQATRATIEVLFGLPFAVSGAAKLCGVLDIQEATTRDVREWFLGRGGGRLRRDDAKRAVIQECRRRGWEVRDDNEADACATWAYMGAVKVPSLRTEAAATPLFRSPAAPAAPRQPARAARTPVSAEDEIPL